MAGRRATKSYERRLQRRALHGWRDGIYFARLKLRNRLWLHHRRQAYILRLMWFSWQRLVSRTHVVYAARERSKMRLTRSVIQIWRVAACQRRDILVKVRYCRINLFIRSEPSLSILLIYICSSLILKSLLFNGDGSRVLIS